MTRTNAYTAPRNGASKARLELIRGGTRIHLRAAEIDELCRAEFEGVAPTARAEGDRVRIAYPRFSLAELVRHPAHRAQIELTRAVPWSVTVDGGLGDSSVDLRGLDLRELEIAGGAGDVGVVLSEPRGVVKLTIRRGASKVLIRRPAGVAVRLRIAGGATRLALDDQRVAASPAGTQLETPDAGSTGNRYEIDVRGGASEFTVGVVDAAAT